MRAHITAFRSDPDEPGAWIAELSCGHTQHVRNQPPFHDVNRRLPRSRAGLLPDRWWIYSGPNGCRAPVLV